MLRFLGLVGVASVLVTGATGCPTRSVCGECDADTTCNPSTRVCEPQAPDGGAGSVRLQVQILGEGTGSVVSSPSGIDCGAQCEFTFNAGEQVELSATPGAQSDFAGWGGTVCQGNKACTFAIEADTVVTATFEAGPCDAATNVCVGAPPIDWLGPVALFDDSVGAETPTCGGTTFPVQLSSAGAGGVPDVSGECTCPDCTPPADARCNLLILDTVVTCGGVSREDRSMSADGRCNTVSTVIFGLDDIYSFPAPGVSTAGSCEPGEPQQDYQAAFARQTVACGESLVRAGGCAADELCVPRVAPPFRQGLCIYREGEHDCPDDSRYAERVVRYDSLDDDRACECTTCADYDSLDCVGATLTLWTGVCTGQSDTYTTGECRDSPLPSEPMGATATPPELPPCPAGPPVETGAVTPRGATTYCCVP